MIKFNDDGILVSYIKEKLHNFNLPMCDVWKDTDKHFNNCLYIDNQYLCIYKDNKKQVVRPYIFNDNITNITKQFILNSTTYDTYTHQYLGKYLQFIKDYKGVDLMSMFNLCSGEIASGIGDIDVLGNSSQISFVVGDEQVVFNTTDSDYKIYVIPVRYNQKYSIGINCNSVVEIVACFYDDILLTSGLPASNLEQFYKNTYEKFSHTTLTSPRLYTKLDNILSKIDDAFYYNKNVLKLLIKVPASCASSLVVVEGEVPLTNIVTIYGQSEKNNYNITMSVNVNKYKDNKRQLFYIDDNVIHPFADRLIEYLTNSAICPLDDIDTNIALIQKYLSVGRGYELNRLVKTVSKEYTIKNFTKWSEDMTELIAKLLNYSSLNRNRNYYDRTSSNFDILGYADKDAEEFLRVKANKEIK